MPDPGAATVPELTLISDEFSWAAVIAADGGEVPREEAERIFREHGIELPPEGPEEQRFMEISVTPGRGWGRGFVLNHLGPIHGWEVEL